MIGRFRATNFRCLESVELDLAPGFNLIYGANASGKTSLLEALAYLGRGKSFRGASTQNLIRHGEQEFVLFGEAEVAGRMVSMGVKNSREGLVVRVDGEEAAGAAALAEALPLQVIDPDVHNLIAGGPELRRRYLDWIAFHVEHEHLAVWRRFRRALKQRNAALKSKAAVKAIRSWDAEFVELSGRLDSSRRRVLDLTKGSLQVQGAALLDTEINYDYRSGWTKDKDLAEVLEDGLERDLQAGSTQAGPHRADIKVRYDERQARKMVSRGQQKLLASSMILAAAETAQTSLEKPLLLLLDDPAAELDGESMQRLMTAVASLGCQVVATSLNPEMIGCTEEARRFHVEHGAVTIAD